jgi:hypothetical protein
MPISSRFLTFIGRRSESKVATMWKTMTVAIPARPSVTASLCESCRRPSDTCG